MSDNQSSPPPEHRSPAPVGERSGCLSAFLVLLGIVLLLPGLCAVILVAIDWKGALSSSFLPFLFVCLALAFGGIMLIRLVARGPRA